MKMLRGRVMVSVTDMRKSQYIIMPEQDPRAVRIHRGTVLAMGKPARRGSVEIQPGFDVGDEVLFVWTHNEEAWSAGKYAIVAQENIQAVIEED